MGRLMNEICSPENLEQAWKRCRNDRAHWLPGVPRRDVENELYTDLLRLGNELRKGRYHPAPLRRFTIAKGDGSERDIVALALRDKVAQRAVLQVLQNKFETGMHSDSFGYRPGRNVDMAYSRARTYISEGNAWVMHSDLENCFDRIPLARLRRQLFVRIRDRKLRRVLKRWLKAHATQPRRWFRRARGLPQGGILSPFLVNMYLSGLDHELSRRGLHFVRYGDDVLICCANKRRARSARRQLKRLARRLGLRLNPSKTRIARAGPGITFLGKPLPKPPAHALK